MLDFVVIGSLSFFVQAEVLIAAAKSNIAATRNAVFMAVSQLTCRQIQLTTRSSACTLNLT
jgi:hypothetical protein